MVCLAGSLRGNMPRELGAPGLAVSSYELQLRPGLETIRELGGLHLFTNWAGLLLAYPRPPLTERVVRATEQGTTYASHIDGSRHLLTPERAVQVHEALGADISLALDDARSAERSRRWARRTVDARTRQDVALFGVGGAEIVADLPFDGVAFHGEVEADGVPESWPRHVLDVDGLAALFAAVEQGADSIATETPMRLGATGQVYASDGLVSLLDPALREDAAVIDGACACSTCAGGFSRGYLHHLFATQELLGYTLASRHNCHVLLEVVRHIRAALAADRLWELRVDVLGRYGRGPG
ncbi:MAG: tRNA-guanine transglycosylase [Chloroflexota bacterium]|nr:tRNA-guanine transglycosylase [Chloroflexota bacterium]